MPEEILFRQKEQFSDGVGYGWIDGIQDHAASKVTDEELARAAVRYPIHPPTTKEAYWFRTLFEQHFPLCRGCRHGSRWQKRGLQHGKGAGMGRTPRKQHRSERSRRKECTTTPTETALRPLHTADGGACGLLLHRAAFPVRKVVSRRVRIRYRRKTETGAVYTLVQEGHLLHVRSRVPQLRVALAR